MGPELILLILLGSVLLITVVTRRNPFIFVRRIISRRKPNGGNGGNGLGGASANINTHWHGGTLLDSKLSKLKRELHDRSDNGERIIDYNKGRFFTWIHPTAATVPTHAEARMHYVAVENIPKARYFLHFDIPVNEMFVSRLHEYFYEDVQASLIVDLFDSRNRYEFEKRSQNLRRTKAIDEGSAFTLDDEKGVLDELPQPPEQETTEAGDPIFDGPDNIFYYVASEFRKIINTNVRILAFYYSTIIAAFFGLNWALILFYPQIGPGLEQWLHGGEVIMAGEFELRTKWAILAYASLATGIPAILAMMLLHNFEGRHFQQYNGRELDHYITRYLAFLTSDYRRCESEALKIIGVSSTTDVEDDEALQTISSESQLWFINIQWIAFRAFFIEWFLRGIFYQIMRNCQYYMLLIPLAFVVLFLAIAALANPAADLFNFLFGTGGMLNGAQDASVSAATQLADEDAQQPFFKLIHLFAFSPVFYVMLFFLIRTYSRYLKDSVERVRNSISEDEWQQFHNLGLERAMREIIRRYMLEIQNWRDRFRAGGSG